MDVLDALDSFLLSRISEGSRRRRRRSYIDFEDYSDSESFDSSTSNHSYLDFLNPMPLKKLWRPSDEAEQSQEEVKPKTAMKLVDLAAIQVAKSCSCQELEVMQPALDEALLKKVAFWAFPQDEEKVQTLARLCLPSEHEWKKGIVSLRSDEIKEIRQVGFMVSAIIYKQSGDTSRENTKVSVTFEKQCITSSTCALCPQAVWCQHIIAVILYRIRFADKVPIHAPVTETLSTLTRDQLQKLLQYAINEDPGGILGRVFQHIDDIRDKNSSLNNVMGAPDPTFGVGLDEKSTWELTLEHMCTNLKDDLKTGRRSYPENFNLKEKLQNNFWEQYLQRFYELLSKNEYEAAGQVLIKIGTLAMEAMKNCRSFYSPRFLLYDLERLFSFFIMTYTGPVREEVILTARNINRETSKTDGATYYSPSEYVDIRTVKLSVEVLDGNKQMEVDGDKPDVLDAVPSAPFYQAVLTSLLPDPPKEFHQLLADNSHSLEIPYEEPVPVMLLRFDRLVQWPWVRDKEIGTTHFDQMLNVGLMILKKLLNLSEKFSILNVKEEKPLVDTLEENRSTSPAFGRSRQISCSSESSQCSSKTVDSSQKRQSRKRKGKTPKSVKSTPAKKSKKESKKKEGFKFEKVEGISVEQMSCILTNVSYSIYCAAKEIDKHHQVCKSNEVLCQAILRAVELGRLASKASKNVLSEHAYSWLYSMENCIKQSIMANLPEYSSSVPQRVGIQYVDTMLNVGLDVYGENIPLSLICLLLNICDLEIAKRVDLCSLALCYSQTPLSDVICSETYYYSYSYSEGMRSKDQVLKRWKDILTIVCEYAHVFPEKLEKVVAHFDTVKDMDFLCMGFGVVNGFMRQMSKKTKEELLSIILKCIGHAVKNPSWNGFAAFRGKSYDALSLLGEELKSEFPRFILGSWKELCDYFKSTHLQGLIEIIKSSVSTETSLTTELSKMLICYFKGNFDHAEDCIELLSILDGRPTYRQEAIKSILDNAKNYSAKALLLLAKLEHESHGCSKVIGKVFHEKVFSILVIALTRLKKHSYYQYQSFTDAVDLTYLRYFYQQLAEHGSAEVAKSTQFTKFMTAVDENCDVDALVAFFESVQPCKPLFDKVKEKLGTTVGKKYYDQFDIRLKRCNHSEYNKILCEMMTARKHFYEYVPDGEDEFKTMLNSIRRDHKNKKKLQKLIIEYFLPQLHKDIVENSVPK